MTEIFVVAQFQEFFSSDAEAIASLREIVVSRDNQRPLDKRFEVEALDRSSPIDLKNGATLFKVANLGFVIAPMKQGGFGLFGSGEGMYFETLSSAEEWVSEFSEIAPSTWAIFEQANAE